MNEDHRNIRDRAIAVIRQRQAEADARRAGLLPAPREPEEGE